MKITVNPLSLAELVDKTESVNIKHAKFDKIFEKEPSKPEPVDQSTQTMHEPIPL